jgi:hypothetical protein
MNWVTGITTLHGQLVAELADGYGKIELVELEGLAHVGLPAATKFPIKKHLTSNFREWKIVQPENYIAAYEMDKQLNRVSNHQVFELQILDKSFQVPALALMRALFYPARYMLAKMFRPQALDDLGFLDGITLNLLHRRKSKSYEWASEPVLSCLKWMFGFPSAYTMAHSVHEHAMRGVVGLTLPDAEVGFVAHGKRIKNTYYVTTLALTKLIANEFAFDFLPDLSRKILELNFRSRDGKSIKIPLRGNDVILSDEEWTAIEPILLFRSNYRFKLSQRDLFDCILTKFHYDIPWRNIECKSGTYIHVCSAYRVWNQRGTFGPALEELSRFRND